MSQDDVDDIIWLQAQLRKYESLLQQEKNLSLKILFRRMTVHYQRRINKIILGKGK